MFSTRRRQLPVSSASADEQAERTGVAHGKKLLGVLAVTLAAEALGHREAELEPGVVVRDDFAVASLPARGRVRGVLR